MANDNICLAKYIEIKIEIGIGIGIGIGIDTDFLRHNWKCWIA